MTANVPGVASETEALLGETDPLVQVTETGTEDPMCGENTLFTVSTAELYWFRMTSVRSGRSDVSVMWPSELRLRLPSLLASPSKSSPLYGKKVL